MNNVTLFIFYSTVQTMALVCKWIIGAVEHSAVAVWLLLQMGNLDIKTTIQMTKQKMVQLNNIWKDMGIPVFLKLKIRKCLIWPVLFYGCEAWTLRKEESDKLREAELMWLYWRLLLLRVSWKGKRTNESVLNEFAMERKIIQEINKRRL